MQKSQLIAVIVAPMATGSISMLASGTLIVTIFRSNVKLSTIYRRILFAMSFLDVLQSFSQAASTLLMPPESGMWGAIGNSTSCDIQGFLTILGCSGTVLYTLSLTIYFLLVIKYNVPEGVIKKRFEPFFHAVPILFSITISVTVLATQNFNPAGTVCWIASEPVGCDKNPDVECVSKGNPATLKWVSVGAPVLVVFVINCIILGLICWTVYSKTKKSQSYRRYSWALNSTSSAQEEKQDEEQGCCNGLGKKKWKCLVSTLTCSKMTMDKQNPELSPLAARFSRPTQASITRLREISNRAIAYIVGYSMTYGAPVIYRIMEQYDYEIPYTIIFLSRLLFPLQGFFNVIVFTYPHVTTYRKNHPGHTYFRAFWEVVKSGGDSDEVARSGRASRRNSLRKQQLVLEQAQSRNRKKTPQDPTTTTTNGMKLVNKDVPEAVRERNRRSSSKPSESFAEEEMKKSFGCRSESQEPSNNKVVSKGIASEKNSLLANHWRQDTNDATMNEHVGTAKLTSTEESSIHNEKKAKVAFMINKDVGVDEALESQQESEESSIRDDNLEAESKSTLTQSNEASSPPPPKVKRSPLYLSSSFEDEDED